MSSRERTYHYIGPPGTGKTRKLAVQAKNAVAKYGSKSVLICSLTKAAAREIASRDTQVHEDMVGTLHAHAFRALGQPGIAETHVKEWNAQCTQEYRLTGGGGSLIDAPEETGRKTLGDDLLSDYNICRAKMEPIPVGADMTKFVRDWTQWKEESGYIDFTDMIEKCIAEVPVHPANPDVILGDEAQDWSKLEMTLIREVWGAHADTIILAGDEDQSLYEWRGSDPHVFSGYKIPAGNTKILEQSYRVPTNIHALALRWIRRIKDRTDSIYYPRKNSTGSIFRKEWRYENSREAIEKAQELTINGNNVMILCHCGYMVSRIVAKMKELGVPFHNPYRVVNAGWNPLLSKQKSMTASDRLRAFLFPDNDNPSKSNLNRWRPETFKAWASILASKGLLVHGVKKSLDAGFIKPPETADEYAQFFLRDEDSLMAMTLNIDWFFANLIGTKKNTMKYPVQIAKKRGKEVLLCVPKIIIGTIHSIKGGEADHVILFPDISRKASESNKDDQIIRIFYVAITRAKESLYLCSPSSPYKVNIN